MDITQHLRKWGNGTAVRLPKKVLDAAKLRAGQPLSIRLHGQSIILTPIKEPAKPSLAQLLKGVTPPKVGGEINIEYQKNLGNAFSKLISIGAKGQPDLSTHLDKYLYE